MTKIDELMIAMEYGYKQHEKGHNFEQAKINFMKIIKGK